MKRLTILAAVLGVTVCGSAKAETTEVLPGPLPTDLPVHIPMIESLEPVAEAYWAARGITLPPVEVFEMPDSPIAAAAAEEPGTRVWLTQGLLELKDGRKALCRAYIHERGHNAGLSHQSGFSVMSPENTTVPARCLHWFWKQVAEIRNREPRH